MKSIESNLDRCLVGNRMELAKGLGGTPLFVKPVIRQDKRRWGWQEIETISRPLLSMEGEILGMRQVPGFFGLE